MRSTAGKRFGRLCVTGLLFAGSAGLVIPSTAHGATPVRGVALNDRRIGVYAADVCAAHCLDHDRDQLDPDQCEWFGQLHDDVLR
jgi:hypothetical protein